VGVDYLRGTTKSFTVWDVVGYISELTGEGVEVQDGGLSGYTRSFWLGPVRVMDNPAREEMGVNVLCGGEACEFLGLERVASVYLGLQLKASRIDIKADNCAFTPADLQREWMRDNVRTLAQKPNPEVWERLGKRIKPGMEDIRSCTWHAGMSGDTFEMGSRSSQSFARCYDSRGFTRFELELKADRAEKAAELLLGVVGEGAPVSFGRLAVGILRNFVDFVDASSSTNRNRCKLLPFWAEFIAGMQRVKLTLLGKARKGLEDAQEHLEAQYAAVVATVYRAHGAEWLWKLVAMGESRMGPKHQRLLADFQKRRRAEVARLAAWRSLEGQIGVCT
jgi:DNA relaxase NicK